MALAFAADAVVAALQAVAFVAVVQTARGRVAVKTYPRVVVVVVVDKALAAQRLAFAERTAELIAARLAACFAGSLAQSLVAGAAGAAGAVEMLEIPAASAVRIEAAVFRVELET